MPVNGNRQQTLSAGYPVRLTFAHAEDRLELLHQIREVEAARDTALKKPAPADEAERMIHSLVDMRAIGAELTTLLVREAFMRPIARKQRNSSRLRSPTSR